MKVLIANTHTHCKYRFDDCWKISMIVSGLFSSSYDRRFIKYNTFFWTSRSEHFFRTCFSNFFHFLFSSNILPQTFFFRSDFFSCSLFVFFLFFLRGRKHVFLRSMPHKSKTVGTIINEITRWNHPCHNQPTKVIFQRHSIRIRGPRAVEQREGFTCRVQHLWPGHWRW